MQVATEFEVSRTPVREALRLLAASGLVKQRAHATAVVAKPEDSELIGMFEVMAYLEGLCASLAARAMTSAERDALDALHLEMARVVQAGDTAGYAEANDRFHNAVYAGAHNAYLAEITRSTRQRLQPFRRAQFSALGRLSRSHAEHGAVVDAILRGDAQGAETAMRRHLAIVSDAVQHLGGR
jgi:DNA-binding GntR family transcriptional regulator